MERTNRGLENVLMSDLKLLDELSVGFRKLRSWRVAPQPVEVVKFAHRLVKNVNDHVGKIHQHPMAALYTFDRIGFDPFFTRVFFESLSDALHLAVGTARAKNEIIRDGRELANLQHNQIVGLPFQ